MTAFVAGPSAKLSHIGEHTVGLELFGPGRPGELASAGASLARRLRAQRLAPASVAWDFASLALAVVVADTAVRRAGSPDGWTRLFELEVCVSDPDRWDPTAEALEAALAFLTTDVWRLRFVSGGQHPDAPKEPWSPDDDVVALLSGGLDSLIGAIDLSAEGTTAFAVSQIVRGDQAKQNEFAATIGGGLHHIALNHNARPVCRTKEPSQRARSMGFIALGCLVASSLDRYRSGEQTDVHINENGFIAINPPLTPARLGSLSTRTAHPHFLGLLQEVLDQVGLDVTLRNPYALATKGEMLESCADQALLERLASQSTSCGRFQRYGYRHCGRCVPCQVRRAAFLRWGATDPTEYVYEHLGIADADHSQFDDVRSTAMAISQASDVGVDRWSGTALSSRFVSNRSELTAMLRRGLVELHELHVHLGVS